MKKFFKNPYILILFSVVPNIIFYYIIPILPDIDILLKYIFIFIKFVIPYGVCIGSIIYSYRYDTFNKMYVLKNMLYTFILIALIALDVLSFLNENIARWISEATGSSPLL